MNVLLLLALPAAVRHEYRDRLQELFPELTITLVEHHSKALTDAPHAEVLMTFGAHMSDAVLERATNLKWIQALGTGVDGIVGRPALREGVIVTNVHGKHGGSMSESVLASMLAFARELPRVFRNQREKRWDRFPAELLQGKTVGILGVGAIAEELARKCKALGMTVVGISASRTSAPGFDRIEPRERLKDLVGELDFVVTLVPYTPETHHIVNQPILEAMKPTSVLINVGRGPLVDEAALVEALRDRTIRGAALDVFETEPLPPESPLWDLDNVIITPHLGGFHTGYVADAMPVIAENMRRFVAGDFDNMVNVVRR